MKYKELQDLYKRHFSLGYLNCDINSKFALISLVCYVVRKNKLKNPDITHYSLLAKFNDKLHLPDEFIKGLSVVCDDMSYGCTEFPTFDLKGKEILQQIINILKTYVPF